MKQAILGWDVGGANIKAVCLDAASGGSETGAVQRAFPLWREPDRLPRVLGEVARTLVQPDRVYEMAVTMTAELADCFATKSEGVVFVLDAFRSAFPETSIRVYGADGRFRSADEACQDPLAVAAANWMASAALVSRTLSDVLLVDVGSTTTDIIPIVGGSVVVQGRTDVERLISSELVYTGVLRTPVCAIVQTVPVGGHPCRVAAERFAIAADVHLWLDHIAHSDYTCETPDGRGTSRQEAGARLARMVCADLREIGEDTVTVIAEHVADAQVEQIANAIDQVRGRQVPDAPGSVVITGHGGFLAECAAAGAGLPVLPMPGNMPTSVADVGPAAAVAHLLADSRQRAGTR